LDDFRYVNFSRSNVDVGADFNVRDGIFRVPVSGKGLAKVCSYDVLFQALASIFYFKNLFLPFFFKRIFVATKLL
jgi:hypothetical protein